MSHQETVVGNPLLDQANLAEEFSSPISRILSKAMGVIPKTYTNMKMIDLLMAMSIRPVFHEIDLATATYADGTSITMQEIAIQSYITRDKQSGNMNRLIVHLVFTKDVNQSWEDFFDKLVNTRNTNYHNEVSFTYLHEAMHILMKHYDYYQILNHLDTISQYRPDFSDEEMEHLLGMAQDYWINAYLIEQAASDSFISKYANDTSIHPKFLYDPNLSPKITTQEEIIIKLAKDADIKTHNILNADGTIWGRETTITIGGITRSFLTHEGDHNLEPDDSTASDEEMTNAREISDILSDTRSDLLNKSRGDSGTGSFSQLGVDYSVPIDWFQHLKASVFGLSQKYTSKSEPTWGKIKTKYRHIATLPGRTYYDKEMAVIVSIDQSGSMSDQDLEKINYVVTELAKKSVFVEILLHDTQVAARERFVGSKFTGIRDFVTNRVACGGTSHREVFSIIKEIHEEKRSRKLIYLSFSDNYSDIESCYSAELFRKIPAYWIVTQGGKPVGIPGMQIALDNGLLQH